MKVLFGCAAALAVLAPPGPAAAEDWPMAGGNPARSRVSKDLPDTLSRHPLWRMPLWKRDPRWVPDRLAPGAWALYSPDRAPTPAPNLEGLSPEYARPYPSLQPISLGGKVLYKDYLHILLRRAATGGWVLRFLDDAATWVAGARREGTLRSTQRFPADLARPLTGLEDRGARVEGFYRYGDYGGNALVAHGGFLIAVEHDSGRGLRSKSMLTVHQLRTGKLHWAWDQRLPSLAVHRDPKLARRWEEDYRKHARAYIRGPGLPVGDLLYTVAESESGVSLWAFGLEDGLVRFRTRLDAAVDATTALPVAACLAHGHGLLFVVTHSGRLTAVEAESGTVAWQRTYRRRKRQDRFSQGFALNHPIVVDELVIVAPADGDEICGFDARTGHRRWSHTRRDVDGVAHVVGVSSGVLVMAGWKAMGLDVKTGAVRWGPHQLGAEPYGRGFVGAERAYVPTFPSAGQRRARIERFDLRTGRRANPLVFEVARLGNLLYLEGRLLAATDEEVMCFSTQEQERGRLKRQLAQDPAAWERWLELAELSLLEGGVAGRKAAVLSLERGLAAAGRKGAHDRRLRTLAIENLLFLARAERSFRRLGEAMQVAAGGSTKETYRAQIRFERARLLAAIGRPEEGLAALEQIKRRDRDAEVVWGDEVVSIYLAMERFRDLVRPK